MRSNAMSGFFFVIASIVTGELLAQPATIRYSINTNDQPFRESRGLGGFSGDYDLRGEFTLTIDPTDGTASMSNFDVLLQGTPVDFDLNGVLFHTVFWHDLDTLTGILHPDGSLHFERRSAVATGLEIYTTVDIEKRADHLIVAGRSAWDPLVDDGGGVRLASSTAVLVPELSGSLMLVFLAAGLSLHRIHRSRFPGRGSLSGTCPQ